MTHPRHARRGVVNGFFIFMPLKEGKMEYHKIYNIYGRSNKGKLIEGAWNKDLEPLKDLKWVWQEKVDGTNIRVVWDGTVLSFGGKTDNAQIPTHLLAVLKDKFTPELMDKTFGDKSVCLYGEGFGDKIQMPTGSSYRKESADFILFDVRIGNWWLTINDCRGIAMSLGCLYVPTVNTGTLESAVELVKRGYKSLVADDTTLDAEGLIVRPPVDLFFRNGERVIAKIKARDFIN